MCGGGRRRNSNFIEVNWLTQLIENLDMKFDHREESGRPRGKPLAMGLAPMRCSELTFYKYLHKHVNQHPKIRTQTYIMCKPRASVYLWGRDHAMATPGLDPGTLWKW